MSALGAALNSERLCIHLTTGSQLHCAASIGLPEPLAARWSALPIGAGGGPAGLAAAAARPVIAADAQADWAPFTGLASAVGVASSWSVPVLAREGLTGVITVFRDAPGQPKRDQLELVTVYAGYAASAIERDRLLDEVTERNRVLETIREVLETLAGPIPVSEGLGLALQALCRGLKADEVTLLTSADDGPLQWRGSATAVAGRSAAGRAAAAEPPATHEADAERILAALDPALLADQAHWGRAYRLPVADGLWRLVVSFAGPNGPSLLSRRLADRAAGIGGHRPGRGRGSLAAARARTGESRASLARGHGAAPVAGAAARLPVQAQSRAADPLTAIRGYATSLLQPDVTWDAESQHRFLTSIAAESARLGRLVDDLLDFSAIELGILRLQPDWCDLALVLEAAAACLPPDSTGMIEISCAAELPVVWADHDRLEQVFVNLLANAVGHNPAGTPVTVRAEPADHESVAVTVSDFGVGLPPEVAAAPFESSRRGRRTRTSGAGLGLSIARGIVIAHGGQMEVQPSADGASFRVLLPVEQGSWSAEEDRVSVPRLPADGKPAQRIRRGGGRP